jgi:hypothetical protein
MKTRALIIAMEAAAILAAPVFACGDGRRV